MSTSKSNKNFFAAFRPTLVNKLTIVEASEQLFNNFLELHTLEKKFDEKIAQLNEDPLAYPTYISDVGKHLFRAMQLPTKNQRTAQAAQESTVRIESILVKAREDIREEELSFYRKEAAATKTALRSYLSEPQLAAYLLQKASPAPEAEALAEARNLSTTITAFLDQEKEKLSAMETEKVPSDSTSNAAILSALTALQQSVASLQKTQQRQKNETSRSNLPQQSNKTKNPPPQKHQQQQPRGRSQSREKNQSQSRGRSGSVTANRRVKDSARSDRSRSTSRGNPKRNSSR